MKAQWKLTGSPSIPHVSSCKVMYFRYNYDWCIIGFFLISAHWFSQVTLINFDPQASASQQQFEERRFHLVLANPRPRGTAEPRGFWPPAGRIQSLQSFRKWWGKKHKRFIIIVQKTYWNSHFGVIIIYLLPDKLVQVFRNSEWRILENINLEMKWKRNGPWAWTGMVSPDLLGELSKKKQYGRVRRHWNLLVAGETLPFKSTHGHL